MSGTEEPMVGLYEAFAMSVEEFLKAASEQLI
jgi:hypothetical protein